MISCNIVSKDKECRKIDNNEQSDDSEDEHMSKEELEKAHQKATKHKSDGNILVQQQKWSEAIGCYTEAIKLFPYDAVFYANRALCQLKLDKYICLLIISAYSIKNYQMILKYYTFL